MKKDLSTEQVSKIDTVAAIIRDLGQNEHICFREILYEETQKRKGRHPVISGNHLVDPFRLEDGTWPHLVNGFLQSEAMAKIWAGKMAGFGGKAKVGGRKSEVGGGDVVVVEEEAPKEVLDSVIIFFFRKRPGI